MRLPIKFNQRRLPLWIARWLPSKDDPRELLFDAVNIDHFETAVTAIKIGSTWKSTRRKRHVLSDTMIYDALARIDHPLILEIGVSAGSTTLDLLERLGERIGKYWATDLFFHICIMQKGRETYFYHPLSQHCIMRVNDHLLVYEETANALPPFGWIAAHFIARAPVLNTELSQEVSLIHPLLRNLAQEDERVVICEHDVFVEWRKEKVHLVKVANVLNRMYFSDDMIKAAISKLRDALQPAGYLIIVDNCKIEQASLFRLNKNGTFTLQGEVNGGCDIRDLVCSHLM